MSKFLTEAFKRRELLTTRLNQFKDGGNPNKIFELRKELAVLNENIRRAEKAAAEAEGPVARRVTPEEQERIQKLRDQLKGKDKGAIAAATVAGGVAATQSEDADAELKNMYKVLDRQIQKMILEFKKNPSKELQLKIEQKRKKRDELKMYRDVPEHVKEYRGAESFVHLIEMFQKENLPPILKRYKEKADSTFKRYVKNWNTLEAPNNKSRKDFKTMRTAMQNYYNALRKENIVPMKNDAIDSLTSIELFFKHPAEQSESGFLEFLNQDSPQAREVKINSGFAEEDIDMPGDKIIMPEGPEAFDEFTEQSLRPKDPNTINILDELKEKADKGDKEAAKKYNELVVGNVKNQLRGGVEQINADWTTFERWFEQPEVSALVDDQNKLFQEYIDKFAAITEPTKESTKLYNKMLENNKKLHSLRFKSPLNDISDSPNSEAYIGNMQSEQEMINEMNTFFPADYTKLLPKELHSLYKRWLDEEYAYEGSDLIAASQDKNLMEKFAKEIIEANPENVYMKEIQAAHKFLGEEYKPDLTLVSKILGIPATALAAASQSKDAKAQSKEQFDEIDSRYLDFGLSTAADLGDIFTTPTYIADVAYNVADEGVDELYKYHNNPEFPTEDWPTIPEGDWRDSAEAASEWLKSVPGFLAKLPAEGIAAALAFSDNIPGMQDATWEEKQEILSGGMQHTLEPIYDSIDNFFQANPDYEADTLAARRAQTAMLFTGAPWRAAKHGAHKAGEGIRDVLKAKRARDIAIDSWQ